MRWTMLIAGLLVAGWACAGEPINEASRTFLAQYCVDCHRGPQAESGVRFDDLNEATTEGIADVDWSRSEQVEFWEQVHFVVSDGEMPPKEATSPTESERMRFVQWLERRLLDHVSPTNATPRRLNREEYESTIRMTFEPARFFNFRKGFPPMSRQMGLITSPSLW